MAAILVGIMFVAIVFFVGSINRMSGSEDNWYGEATVFGCVGLILSALTILAIVIVLAVAIPILAPVALVVGALILRHKWKARKRRAFSRASEPAGTSVSPGK